MQFYQAFFNFLLSFKHIPQHPIADHPQPVFFPQKPPSFTTTVQIKVQYVEIFMF
jgi:hypothetical protein